MAGTRGQSGGARPNSGPKPRVEVQELRAAMNDIWSQSARKKAINKAARMAEAGDINALKLLMSYSYGTPPSGDELRIAQEVQKQLDAFIQMVRARLPAADANRILSLLALPASDTHAE